MRRFTPSGLVTAAVLAAAFAVGSVVNSYLPTRADIMSEPYPVAGVLDEYVPIRTGEVKATNLRLATDVTVFGSTAKTSGIFAVVDVTYATNGQERVISPIFWRGADGKRYGGSQPGPRITACGSSVVGIPVTCTIWFELPTDAIAGGHLLVHNYRSAGGDSIADIDLQITDEDAAAMLAAATSIEAESTRYERRQP